MATLTIQPDETTGEDCFLYSVAATTNYATGDLLIGESNADAAVARSLLQFDLSSIPTGVLITSATLTLTFAEDGNYRATNSRTARVYRVLRNWVESEATWNIYSTGNNWGTAGCANTSTDRGATDIGTASFSTGNSANETVVFTLNAANIQEMIGGGSFTNNGFLIKVDTESDDLFYFCSSGEATESYRPKLTITYRSRSLAELRPQTNLVALWPLNGDSNDFSGNNYHGIDTAMSYVSNFAKFGLGGSFNGSSSKIVISDTAALKPTTAFSILGWIKTGYFAATQTIFQSYSQNSNVAGISITLPTSRVLRFLSGDNTGTTENTDWDDVYSTTIISDAAKHCFVAVWSGTQLLMYIDGALEGTTNWANAPGYAATNYVRIGCGNATGGDNTFANGYLDEMALFSRALTAGEIRRYYGHATGKL